LEHFTKAKTEVFAVFESEVLLRFVVKKSVAYYAQQSAYFQVNYFFLTGSSFRSRNFTGLQCEYTFAWFGWTNSTALGGHWRPWRWSK